MAGKHELPGGIVLADTATTLGADAAGAVIVTGSHGGRYAAFLTLSARPRAVVHHDAGVGKDEAGIAVLAIAQALGVAAATVTHTSCRIGEAGDMLARGIVGHANGLAGGLGVVAGMPCGDAAIRLLAAVPGNQDPEPVGEGRRTVRQPDWRCRVVLLDSASLVRPPDRGQLVVTGSHGGLIGGQPEAALRVDAFAAVFHDAGGGIDRAGFARLPALDQRGIAAVTVAARSARIGEAASIYEEGIISHVNETARGLGAREGEPLKLRLAAWARMP